MEVEVEVAVAVAVAARHLQHQLLAAARVEGDVDREARLAAERTVDELGRRRPGTLAGARPGERLQVPPHRVKEVEPARHPRVPVVLRVQQPREPQPFGDMLQFRAVAHPLQLLPVVVREALLNGELGPASLLLLRVLRQ